MSFQFDNIVAFLSMNGHGGFVWSSYLVTALALVCLVIIPYRQKRELSRQIRRQQRIDDSSFTQK
jgi:heme exporter protein D